MVEVETKWHDDQIQFIRRDGVRVVHDCEFQYNGKEYYFLGGFYYDLEPDLADHLFGG